MAIVIYDIDVEEHANKSGGTDNFPATGSSDRAYNDLSKTPNSNADKYWIWTGVNYVKLVGPRPRPHT